MSISKIKTNSKGSYVDFEFRRKRENSNDCFKKYKRVYLDDDLTKIRQNQQAKLLYSEFLAECEEEFKLSYFPVNNSITLAQFIDIFLDNIKTTKTLAHYSNYEYCSILVKEKIGNIKLKDLTPSIIQEFYDSISNLRKDSKQVCPKKNFSEIIESLDYKAKKFKNEINSAHFRHIKNAKEGKMVSTIWAKQFSDYVNIPFSNLFIQTVGDDFSYTTKKRYVTFLKACLAEAKRKLLIKENYAKAEFTNFMKNPEANKKVKSLTKEEYFKLYEYILKSEIDERKMFFVIMMNTGARKEEVFGLKWQDINLEKSELEFNNTVTRVSGYGKKVNLNSTKNKSSNRKIKFSDEMLDIIYEYREYYTSKYNDFNPEMFLFLDINDDVLEVSDPCKANRWLNQLLKVLKFRHVTVHEIRHSFATLMINHLPLANVSKNLGHSQVSTTLNIYTHAIEDENAGKNIKDIVYENETINLLQALILLRNNDIISETEFNEKKKLIDRN